MWFWIVAGLIVFVGFVAFTGAPYVPSKRRDVRRAFVELYPLGPSDTLVDIGSGDGIVLREASRRGARAVGYEIQPLLVVISRLLSRYDPHVRILYKNFWHASFPDETTVVYTFGEGRDIHRMYTRVQAEATRLERPIAFISYAFAIDGITPEKTVGAHYLYQIAPLHDTSVPV